MPELSKVSVKRAQPSKASLPPTLQSAPYTGPSHVLLRVRSENGETVEAHQQMVGRKGSALLGKTGQAIGPEFRELINNQIAKGISTYLFLTTREGWNGPYVTYRCLLRGVAPTIGAGKGGLVPAYYAFDPSEAKTWFEIASVERLSRDEMDKIFVLSSGRSIMSSIASSATVFRVGVSTKRV